MKVIGTETGNDWNGIGKRNGNELRKRNKVKECVQENIGFWSGSRIVLGLSQS